MNSQLFQNSYDCFVFLADRKEYRELWQTSQIHENHNLLWQWLKLWRLRQKGCLLYYKRKVLLDYFLLFHFLPELFCRIIPLPEITRLMCRRKILEARNLFSIFTGNKIESKMLENINVSFSKITSHLMSNVKALALKLLFVQRWLYRMIFQRYNVTFYICSIIPLMR